MIYISGGLENQKYINQALFRTVWYVKYTPFVDRPLYFYLRETVEFVGNCKTT